MDMDRVLMTGDKLYTFLQRSSSISDRYLLVEELPHLFECFNQSYEFHANESLPSVIMADDGINYAAFNALPLDEAIQIALTDTDGFFVCFGGNTLLIGKLQNGFFSFDSHSRSTEGMLSIFGKSTRVLLQSVEEVFSHIQNLALSMGYSKSVECNLTGVSCKMNYIGNDRSLHKTGDIVTHFEQTNRPVESSFETDDGKDYLIFIAQDQLQFSFPL